MNNYNMFSENPFIDVTQYIDSNMTIEEIEKIEMKKIKKLKDNFISTHTENDYFLKLSKNNQAIFLFPNKNDGTIKDYDTITIKNCTIEFNKCDFLNDFSDKEISRIENSMVSDAKELKNLAETTKQMIVRLLDIKNIFPQDEELPYFKSNEFKEYVNFSEFYPDYYDKSKTLKDIINEVDGKNKKKKESILRHLEIAKNNYIGKLLINKRMSTIVEIEDFFLKEENDGYSIVSRMNIIYYYSLTSNGDTIIYNLSELRNPHSVVIGLHEPLYMYKPSKKGNDYFHAILDNIRKIESINKRFKN